MYTPLFLRSKNKDGYMVLFLVGMVMTAGYELEPGFNTLSGKNHSHLTFMWIVHKDLTSLLYHTTFLSTFDWQE